MLLAELRGRRPKKAGKAVLEYGRSDQYPYRKDDVIVLPDRGDLELYRLQPGWNQFVARFDFSTVWFGGTDENPFLVRINDAPFREYCQRGPRGFYESLVPELPGQTYRRQGDIFATPIPFTWDEIIKALQYILGWSARATVAKPDENGGGLFGTRHHLVGMELASTVRLPIEGSNWADHFFVIAEGTVRAPDHTDMKLEGVCALAQTQHLHDPRVAD